MNFENGKMKGLVPNFLRLFCSFEIKMLCVVVYLLICYGPVSFPYVDICHAWHNLSPKKNPFLFFSFCWLTTTHCNCIDFLRSCQSWMALGHKSSCYGGCSWTIGTNQRKFAFWLQGATATFDPQKSSEMRNYETHEVFQKSSPKLISPNSSNFNIQKLTT